MSTIEPHRTPANDAIGAASAPDQTLEGVETLERIQAKVDARCRELEELVGRVMAAWQAGRLGPSTERAS